MNPCADLDAANLQAQYREELGAQINELHELYILADLMNVPIELLRYLRTKDSVHEIFDPNVRTYYPEYFI